MPPETPPKQQEVREVGLTPEPIEEAPTPKRPLPTINSPRKVLNAEMDDREGDAGNALQEETMTSQEQHTPVIRVEELVPVQLRRGTRVRRKPVQNSL